MRAPIEIDPTSNVIESVNRLSVYVWAVDVYSADKTRHLYTTYRVGAIKETYKGPAFESGFVCGATPGENRMVPCARELADLLGPDRVIVTGVPREYLDEVERMDQVARSAGIVQHGLTNEHRKLTRPEKIDLTNLMLFAILVSRRGVYN